MTLTQVPGVGIVQQGILILLCVSRVVRLGCAHWRWPLTLFFKHQLKFELALIPARAWRGPHRRPPDKDRIPLDECNRVHLSPRYASKVSSSCFILYVIRSRMKFQYKCYAVFTRRGLALARIIPTFLTFRLYKRNHIYLFGSSRPRIVDFPLTFRPSALLLHHARSRRREGVSLSLVFSCPLPLIAFGWVPSSSWSVTLSP